MAGNDSLQEILASAGPLKGLLGFYKGSLKGSFKGSHTAYYKGLG